MSKSGEQFGKNLDKYKYEMYEALSEISLGKGRYSLEPLTHASNTIDDMKELALEVIAKIEGRTE